MAAVVVAEPRRRRNVTGASWTGGGKMLTTTGRVLFHLSSGDYICSGSVVDDGDATRQPRDRADRRPLRDREHGGHVRHQLAVHPRVRHGPDLHLRATDDDTAAGSPTRSTPAPRSPRPAASTTTAAPERLGLRAGHDRQADGGQLDATVGSFPIAFSSRRRAARCSAPSAIRRPAPYNGSDLVYCRGPVVVRHAQRQCNVRDDLQPDRRRLRRPVGPRRRTTRRTPTRRSAR